MSLFSSLSNFGRIDALLSAIFSTVIACFMIYFGIKIINHKAHLKPVSGIITKSSYDCNRQIDDKNTTTCEFNVSYELDDKTYTKTFSSTSRFSTNESVTVWYDPSHHNQAEFDPTPKSIGLIQPFLFYTSLIFSRYIASFARELLF